MMSRRRLILEYLLAAALVAFAFTVKPVQACPESPNQAGLGLTALAVQAAKNDNFSIENPVRK